MGPIRARLRGRRAASVALFLVLLVTSRTPASQPAISMASASIQSSTQAPPDLPIYQPPQAFSEELVIHSRGQTLSMKRAIDGGKVRTDMAVEGKNIVMLEMGDEKGTSYTLLTEEKRAIKQSRQATAAIAGKSQKMPAEMAARDDAELTPQDYKVDDLGDDIVDGVAARKMRVTMKDGDVLGWFDKATGAPLRLEGTVQGDRADMAWKNRKLAPQSPNLFQVPKGYQTIDMDEAMAKISGAMGGMAGMTGMPGMSGRAGIPGMGDMAGMLKGRGADMLGGMAENLGGSLGASLGGSLGGPIGMIAGRYLGRKVGGMLAQKAASAVP